MFKERCISVTKLRTNTKECLEDLAKAPKYIFVNNRPVAVLLDIDTFEASHFSTELVELKANEVSKGLKKEAALARKSHKKDLMNV